LQLVLLCTLYSQAQGCVCTALQLSVQLGGNVEQPWLMSKHGVIHKTGSTYHYAARGGPSHGHRQHAQKLVEDQTCSFEDMIADRHTHTDRHAYHNTPHSYRGRSNKLNFCIRSSMNEITHVNGLRVAQTNRENDFLLRLSHIPIIDLWLSTPMQLAYRLYATKNSTKISSIQLL